MSRFDVWIIGFEPGDVSPAERLETAFGIDSASARSLEQSVPKIVKHALPAKAAGEMRIALEAIGALVECRPARQVKPVAGATGPGSAAVFHPPGADLFPAGRLPTADADLRPAPQAELSGEPSDSSLSVAPGQLWHRRARRAAATLGAGVAILALGYFFGNSVLRGDADWMGIGFDGLGIYFLGAGGFDLFSSLRS